MKFREKYYLVPKQMEFTSAKKELLKYDFNGIVELSLTPTFYYDIKNKAVLPFEIEEGKSKIVIDDKITNVENVKFIQVKELRFRKDYSLQDFFNDNKDAKCIIFYCPNETTIFHEGYRIRTYIDR